MINLDRSVMSVSFANTLSVLCFSSLITQNATRREQTEPEASAHCVTNVGVLRLLDELQHVADGARERERKEF
jgi:hypothetical protein